MYVDATVHKISCCTGQTNVEELLPCKESIIYWFVVGEINTLYMYLLACE